MIRLNAELWALGGMRWHRSLSEKDETVSLFQLLELFVFRFGRFENWDVGIGVFP
jgi:hypothetical protein